MSESWPLSNVDRSDRFRHGTLSNHATQLIQDELDEDDQNDRGDVMWMEIWNFLFPNDDGCCNDRRRQ